MKKIGCSLVLFLVANGVAHSYDLFENLNDFENSTLTSIVKKVSESSQYRTGYFKGKIAN